MGDRPLHPHGGDRSGDERPLRDPEVEALVRRTPLPPARGAFRDALQQAFVRGSFPRSKPRGETASRAPDPVRTSAVDVENMEHSLARTPIAPPARPEFRDELRRSFLTGQWPDFETFEAESARPAGKLLRFLIPVAAAAAIVIVTILTPRERRWDARILGPDSVEVAGISLGTNDEARIGVEASRGGPIVVGESGLELVLEDRMVLEIRPQTTLTLQPLPDAGAEGQLVVDIERGEAFLRTLEDGLDFRVTFTTDEAWVHVVGTALGVLANDTGTCICVSEGSVRVVDRTADEEPDTVAEGFTHFIFKGAAMGPKRMPFGQEPQHTDPLVRFTRS